MSDLGIIFEEPPQRCEGCGIIAVISIALSLMFMLYHP